MTRLSVGTAVEGVFDLQQPARRRRHECIDRIRADRQRLGNGALEEAISVSGAATNARAALTMHHLPICGCAHDMLTGPIEAVVLHAHGEVALIVARVIGATRVEAERDGCFRASAVRE